eukprot:TRINITY_DN102775_c0_g1_i1.p1 TRINITY_DN102775_c0_g1~~TRINITY_DN102775_c0_g1_i1.p1  ORF type:complete len:411 (+),score=47.72 TRINITY_DN102775_c0_g1_i1:131-1363(+)
MRHVEPLLLSLATAWLRCTPADAAAAHVFTFADHFQDSLCNLAGSVEAAGGRLHILGLQHGGPDFKLPFGDLDAPKEDDPWHFADRTVMLKKHVFLANAIKKLKANETVVFLDGFDVLFQRPLEELVSNYHTVASKLARRHGRPPVLFGGELNCWPFPHEQSLLGACRGPNSDSDCIVHTIPDYAYISTDHNAKKTYPLGGNRSVLGETFCSKWLADVQTRHATTRPVVSMQPEDLKTYFPFLCAGTFMGTASAMRRFLKYTFQLYTETREYHDQALFANLILHSEGLGDVDIDGRLFLTLHGHEEAEGFQSSMLEGTLCRGDHFSGTKSPSASPSSVRLFKDAADARPPAMRRKGSSGGHVPPVLHFNGNAKQHYPRCVDEFKRSGFIGSQGAACTYYDGDRRQLVQLA